MCMHAIARTYLFINQLAFIIYVRKKDRFSILSEMWSLPPPGVSRWSMLVTVFAISQMPAACTQSPTVSVNPENPCLVLTSATPAEWLELECGAFLNIESVEGSYSWAGPGVGTDRAGPANGSELQIRPVLPEDSGTYTCTFSPAGHGGPPYTSNTTVRVIDPARFSLPPTNHTAVLVLGTEGVVRCPVAYLGNPPVDIIWRREEDGRPIVQGNRITFRDGGRELVISHVTSSDAGTYSCSLNATCGLSRDSERRFTTVSVTGGLAPSLNCSLNHSTVTLLFNESHTLTCDPVEGTLPIYHEWRNPTSEVIYAPKLELTPSSLTNGDYTCIVNNMWGEASLVTHVRVLAPPILAQKSHYENTSRGQSATLQCNLDEGGHPPYPTPHWSWYVVTANTTLKNITNQTLHRVSVSSSGRNLVIDPVTEEDYSSQFVCVVNNSIGEDRQTSRLLNQEDLSLCVQSDHRHSRRQLAEECKSYFTRHTHSCRSHDNCILDVKILSLVEEDSRKRRLVGVVKSSLPGVVEQLNSSLAGGETIPLGRDTYVALDCASLEGDDVAGDPETLHAPVLVGAVGAAGAAGAAVVMVTTIAVLLAAALCYQRRGKRTQTDAERGYATAASSTSSSSLESSPRPFTPSPLSPGGNQSTSLTDSGPGSVATTGHQ